jgi:hypothetical protein
MHVVGVKTLEALRSRWPELAISAREGDYQNRLTVLWTLANGRKFAVSTPEHVDYRQHPYLWWLHRCSTHIKDTLA